MCLGFVLNFLDIEFLFLIMNNKEFCSVKRLVVTFGRIGAEWFIVILCGGGVDISGYVGLRVVISARFVEGFCEVFIIIFIFEMGSSFWELVIGSRFRSD